jgi:hypothetical protein
MLHILVWSLLFILPSLLLYSTELRDRSFIYEVWFQMACYAAIFYLSYAVLAPHLFFKGKRLWFFLVSALVILLFTLLVVGLKLRFDPILHGRLPQLPGPPGMEAPAMNEFRPPPGRGGPMGPLKRVPLFNFLLTSCLVTGMSLGLRFSEKLLENEKRRKEAEKEKLNTELSLLKHQINPHFLFNTLNSIYSLALIRSDLTADAVMKLSDMMRYVIQDAAQELVPLQLELQYMMHYVELQKIRLSDKVDVGMTVEGDPAPHVIPPMILVPFIENAFKFGTSTHEASTILVRVRIMEGKLSFSVSNRIFAGRENRETFGIGLRNTQQRLSMIYPGRHRLDLVNNGQVFIVNLEIPLA